VIKGNKKIANAVYVTITKAANLFTCFFAYPLAFQFIYKPLNLFLFNQILF